MKGHINPAILCVIALILAATALSCAATDNAVIYSKDGHEYGVVSGTFRHRWWNYYERGQSYLSGGYFADAARDIAMAIGQRDEDQRRARTYGLHFVDYFPHRELGIAYLGMGNVDGAVHELETSISQEESAKAKFYLNKARAAQLKSGGGAYAPPEITFGVIPEIVNTPSLDVSGSVTSPAYVSSVIVGGAPEYIELADKGVEFKKGIPLREGSNTVTVTATDLLGKTSVRKTVVVLDTHGPTMTVDDAGGDVKVYARDASGIVSMRLNGRDVPFKSVDGEAVFDLGLTQLATINIDAVDGAGNTTTAELGLGGPGYGDEWYDTPTSWRGPAGRGEYEPVASGNDAVQVAPKRAPVIKLKGLTATQKAYLDSVYVDGYAAGRSRITSVYINGELVQIRPGKKVFFGFLVELKEGKNDIDIEAEDEAGNTSTRSVEVERMPRLERSISERLSVSPLPFGRSEAGGLSGMAYNAFMDSLFGLDRFSVVERQRLEEVLEEQKLSASELADPATAARLGKITAAEGVIVGSYTETESSVEIYCRFVDTETSEVVEAHDVYGEDKSIAGVASLMEGLAVKFGNSFPMVEGMIIKVDGDSITTDLGKGSGLRKNTLILMFRDGQHVINPVTGKDLGAPAVVLGKARVSEVYDGFSVAEVVRKDSGGKAAAMDRVITK